MEIRISPTTPAMMFISGRFIGISALTIWMLFRDIVKHMLVVNASVQRFVAYMETTVYVGYMSVEDDGRLKKMKLIGQTPAVEDMVLEESEQKMALDLEEDRVDS